ncbi:Panacea domain-containing protein [Nonomuraea sp. NPDC004186]
MPASARAVVEAFRQRRSQLGARKLQALLYYAQGHHLAFSGRPLFEDTIAAGDTGPGVDACWDEEADTDNLGALSEAELNTIGYVLSRYGSLSTQELEDRIHAEPPWQRADAARWPSGDAAIEVGWLREFFAAQAGKESDLGVDPAEVKDMLQAAMRRMNEPRRTDSLEDIRAWLAARA